MTAPRISSSLPPNPGPRAFVPPARPPAPSPVVVFDHVSKWYGPVLGVNQVTLELRAGLTGLVGPNGAGKSTLLRLAAGLVAPDLGAVEIHGLPAVTPAAKRLLGFCPDHDRFYEEMTGHQFVLACARLSGYSFAEARRRTDDALQLVGMADRADRPLRGFSKGMRQRVKLAQALVHDPSLVILDEPLSGIDPLGRRELLDLFARLAQSGKCLLVSSHELDELERLTNHVVVLAHGRVAAVGTLAQIRERLDDVPCWIRLDTDQPRRLAGMLLTLDQVVGVELVGEDSLRVRARQVRQFLRDLMTLVLEEHVEISRLETLDESAEAVLGYMVNGRSKF